MKGFEFLLKEYLRKNIFTWEIKKKSEVSKLLDVCDVTDMEAFCNAIEIVEASELHIEYLVCLVEEIRKELVAEQEDEKVGGTI